MEVGLDRLSALPDSLRSLILSKLPIRDSIRCSVLSKEWRLLHREIPNLILSPYLLTSIRLLPPTLDLLSLTTVENRISDILRLHSSDLKFFSLLNDVTYPGNLHANPSPWQFTRHSISEWMQCVARKNVENLFLRYSSVRETPPPALFSCNRLTTLTLYNSFLTTLPTHFAGFKNLIVCSFISVELTDESLAHFVLHCPLLQHLHILRCDGLQRPAISALNITDLVLLARSLQVLTVNCPNLKSLTTSRIMKDLTVNGILFHELSPAIRGLEMELGSNLIEMSLYSSLGIPLYQAGGFSADRFLEILGKLKSLKVLSINLRLAVPGERRMAVPLLNLLSRLPNLERFHLHGQLILEELEGDPLLPATLRNPCVKLELVEVQINKYDERELDMLGCLLQIAPALKHVKLRCLTEHHNNEYNRFLEKWESLKKVISVQRKMSEKKREFTFQF